MPAKRKSRSSKRANTRSQPRVDSRPTGDGAQPEFGLETRFDGDQPGADELRAAAPDGPPPPPATGPVRGSWQAPRARGAVQARRYAFRRS